MVFNEYARFFAYSDSLFLPGNKLFYQIDEKSGVLTKTYNLHNYFSKNIPDYTDYSSFEYVMRFMILEGQDNQNKLIDPARINKVIFNHGINKYFSQNNHIIQNGVFLDEDETRMFAVDMKTGKEIWWIDKTKLENPWRLLIIDSRGILISQGYRLTCFRAIDEQ